MLSPCDCFLHRAPAPLPPPLNRPSNLTASVPGASCRDKCLTFQINAVSAPVRRTAVETHPDAAVVPLPRKVATARQTTLQGRRKDKGQPGKLAGYGGSIPAMLDALDRVRDVREALRPWRDTLSGRERTILLKEQRDWRRAMQIFRWFCSRGDRGDGENDEEVNVIHYNVVLCAVSRARRWDLIVGLWRQMRSRGVAPDNATYGTLVGVYCKGGQGEDDVAVARQHVQAGVGAGRGHHEHGPSRA